MRSDHHPPAPTAETRPPRRRSTAILAGAILTVVVGGLTATGTTTPAASTDTTGPTTANITDWAPCPGSTDTLCGTLRVPLDWSKPRGEQITLNAVRRPADDPSHRIGVLFFNPGGPSDSPNDDIIAATDTFSDTLRARFDLVGLDPRGVGASAPIRCDVPVLTPDGTLFPRSAEQFDALRRHNRDVGRSCLKLTGNLLRHTDTISVARDHEALRIALGVDKVSWLGLSYGTTLAANYADLFPRHTRAMVLDAALEHSEPEIQQVADELTAAEDSFNRFAAWCPTTTDCALQGQDVATVFDQLVAQADQHPIPVPGALRPVTGEDIRMQTKSLLRFPGTFFGPDRSWAGLSRGLKAAINGDASAFAFPADAPQNQIHVLLGIACMEYAPQIDSYDEMQQRMEMARQLAPHLQGASETWQVNYCIDWPIPPANPPKLLDVRGVPTLMVHATHDASDPYRWAHTLGAQIQGSDLLTRIGDGHTSINTSPCARAAIDTYLVNPVAPATSICTD